MKKFLKSFLLILVTVCVSLPLVACKKKASETTTDVSKVKSVNGIDTNGGITAVYGDYLYFINGVKDNDGTSSTKNKRGAICRVKYNTETGETSGDMEVVIDELVGFANGSIDIFGDYLYYTTPCSEKNSSAEVLYYETSFKRYDLVNNKSYTLYTTMLNDEDETISYEYYVYNNTLNLVVYENKNETIKSFKIDKSAVLNYEISDVESCVLSENYGKPTTSATVDANSFVFYTKAPGTYDYPQTGSKVFKTSPVQDNSVKISEGKDVSLISIRAGKLLYSYNSCVYAQTITSKTTDTLEVSPETCISRAVLSDAIYIENYKLEGKDSNAKLVKSEGDIVVLSFNDEEDAYYFSIFQWNKEGNGFEDNHTNISLLSSAKDFEFIGLITTEEIVVEDDETTEDVNEEQKSKFLTVLFKESDTLYKLRIAEVDEDNADEMKITIHSEKVQLSGSTLADTTGILLPETIGNYLFILSEDDETYLIKVDTTITESNEDESGLFAIVEEEE